MSRPVDQIQIHHAALEASGERVRAWHRGAKADGGNGWRDAGYHYGVEADGSVRLLRRADIDPASAGAARNRVGVAVCVLIDGRKLGVSGHRLKLWWRPLVSLLADLCVSYGLGTDALIDHRDAQAARDCPGWPAVVSEDLRADVQKRLDKMRDDEAAELLKMRRAVARRA